jgi:hypothetical protein
VRADGDGAFIHIRGRPDVVEALRKQFGQAP